MALASLLLAISAGAALVWPNYSGSARPRAEFHSCSHTSRVAVAAQTRLEGSSDRVRGGTSEPDARRAHFHLSYGTYVGLAAAGLGLLSAALVAHETSRARPPLRRMFGVVLTVALLVALLLPWERVGLLPSARASELGVLNPSGVVAAVLAVRLLVVRWRGGWQGRLEQVGRACFFAICLRSGHPRLRRRAPLRRLGRPGGCWLAWRRSR